MCLPATRHVAEQSSCRAEGGLVVPSSSLLALTCADQGAALVLELLKTVCTHERLDANLINLALDAAKTVDEDGPDLVRSQEAPRLVLHREVIAVHNRLEEAFDEGDAVLVVQHLARPLGAELINKLLDSAAELQSLLAAQVLLVVFPGLAVAGRLRLDVRARYVKVGRSTSWARALFGRTETSLDLRLSTKDLAEG